jgi:glycerol 2-dehydrogenase (NADP+)
VPLNPNGSDPVYPKRADGSADFQADWDFLKTWEAMEDLYLAKPSRVRAIGVSNCSTVHLQKILDMCRVVPAANQVEHHPLCPATKVEGLCRGKGIRLIAYSPLGSGNASILENPTIQEISHKCSTSPGRLILSWAVQKGWAVVPKSV